MSHDYDREVLERLTFDGRESDVADAIDHSPLVASVGDRIVTARGVVEVIEARDWPDTDLREYVVRDAAGVERIEHGYGWMRGYVAT